MPDENKIALKLTLAGLANVEAGLNRLKAGLDGQQRQMTSLRVGTTATAQGFAGFNAVIGRLALGLGALGVAGVAVGKGISELNSSVENADAMRRMADQTGIAVESLSRLSYAAKLSDVDMATLSQGLKELAEEMAKAGDKRGLEVRLLEIADQLKAIPDAAERSARAMELIPRAGYRMLPFLNEGADGIRKLMRESDGLGTTISSKFASQADEFNDNIARMKAGTNGLWNDIAMIGLPIAIKLQEALFGIAKAAGAYTVRGMLSDQQKPSGEAGEAPALPTFNKEGASKVAKAELEQEELMTKLAYERRMIDLDKYLEEKTEAIEKSYQMEVEAAKGTEQEINALRELAAIAQQKKFLQLEAEGIAERAKLREEASAQMAREDSSRLNEIDTRIATAQNGQITNNEGQASRFLEYELELLNEKLGLLASLSAQEGQDAERRTTYQASYIQTEQAKLDIVLRMEQLKQQAQQRTLRVTADALGGAAELAKLFGRRGFEVWKKLALAKASIDTASAALGVFNSLAAIPYVGWSMAPVAAIAATMYGAAQIGQIAATQPGFEKGGFTGAGGRNQPAGIVHRGEFVMPQAAVNRIGIPQLEAMRNGFEPQGTGGGGGGGGVGASKVDNHFSVAMMNSRAELKEFLASAEGETAVWDIVTRRRVDIGLST